MTKKREKLVLERVPCTFMLDAASEFESGRFVGIGSVFGSMVDTFPNRTRFRKGSFLKTLNDRGSRVKILSQHDQSSIWIGLPTSLRETDEGLEVAVSLNQTQAGKDAAEALRHAASLNKLDAVELSIGFDPLNFEMVELDDGETVREITEARLWEVSLVNFGADRETKVMEAARLDLESSLIPKGGESMSKRRSGVPGQDDCGCTERQGRSLASALNSRIDSLVENGDDGRGDVVARVARAGGISAGTMNQILNGNINCPPLSRLRGFARSLSIPVSRLISAAERDGCE